MGLLLLLLLLLAAAAAAEVVATVVVPASACLPTCLETCTLGFGLLSSRWPGQRALPSPPHALALPPPPVACSGEIRTIVDYVVELVQSQEFVGNSHHTGWLDARIAAQVRACCIARPKCRKAALLLGAPLQQASPCELNVPTASAADCQAVHPPPSPPHRLPVRRCGRSAPPGTCPSSAAPCCARWAALPHALLNTSGESASVTAYCCLCFSQQACRAVWLRAAWGRTACLLLTARAACGLCPPSAHAVPVCHPAAPALQLTWRMDQPPPWFYTPPALQPLPASGPLLSLFQAPPPPPPPSTALQLPGEGAAAAGAHLPGHAARRVCG